MALKFTRKPTDYISETAYMYDVAQSSQYFDKSVYKALSESGDDDAIKQYVYGVAGAKDKTMLAFNQHDYNYLSAEDKASYTLTQLYGDKDSADYQNAMQYFDTKVQEGIDRETYNSLNGFEKTINSVRGIVGNALNDTILGTVEGLLDLSGLMVGGVSYLAGADEFAEQTKAFVAKDFTSVGDNREALQRYSRAYTYLDKNKVWGVANDVAVGISKMVPMIVGNIAAPGLGTAVYFGAMAGNTAADAIKANPEIDYLSLIGYTAAVTGTEFATEKISRFVLGGKGNFIDNQIFGPTAGKVGAQTAKSWVKEIGLNFLSEGLEESIAEFADTALFNAFIAQGNDDLRKSYSMSDIIYAGIVGGLIGGLMEGASIGATRKLSITEDGRVISLSEAKETGVKTIKDLNKLQSRELKQQLSLSYDEQLKQAKIAAESDALLDLKIKYEGDSLETIKKEHPKEFDKAVKTNQAIANKMTEIALGLNRVHELVGDESFFRIVDLVNGTFENNQRLMSNYVSYVEYDRLPNRAVELAVKKIYGFDVSFNVNDALTPLQIRLRQNLKNKYGVSVYFGDLGSLNGNRKFGLTIDDNTIILDEVQMGQMSEQEILDKLVKEELVHTLQFVKNIITPKTLMAIHEAMGTTSMTKQAVDKAYSGESGLTKLTEAQAKAVAEVLLFDDLTVSKMFYSQYSTIRNVYKFLGKQRKKTEESKELRSQKGKVKYHTLLKTMKMYRDIAAQKLGTAENVAKFIDDCQLTELEQKQLKDAYLENPDIGPIEGFEQAAAFAVEREGLSKEARDILYNEDGTPKTFYKGTNEKGITEFDSTKGKKKRETSSSWFTSSLEVAKSYANEKISDATIYSVDLSQLTNPKIIDAGGERWDIAFEGKSTDDIVREAIAENAGYDAVIITNVVDPGTYSTSRELLKPATDIAVIDNNKINILKEETKAEAGTPATLDLETAIKQSEQETLQQLAEKEPDLPTLTASDGEIRTISLEDIAAVQERLDAAARRETGHKVTNSLQFRIFVEAFPDMTVTEIEDMITKARKQEIPASRLKTKSKTVQDKAEQLMNLCKNIKRSDYQGDVKGHKFASLTNEIIEQNIEFFEEITFEEYSALRSVLQDTKLYTDPRAGAAFDILSRYANLHSEGTQFKNHSELVRVLYANDISSAGRRLGLTSSDYIDHSVSSFVREVASQNGISKINLDPDLLLTFTPEFKNIDEFKNNIIKDIDDLNKRIKNEKDKFTAWELRRQRSSKELVLSALNQNDIALAIDEMLTTLSESNENVVENLQTQSNVYKNIIEYLLTHATFEGNTLKGFGSKKAQTSPTLENIKNVFLGMESFRYLLMLSNPMTAAKNAASNTLIKASGFVEDFALKKLENKPWLRQSKRQVRFTGDYDADFSKWCVDHFKTKVEADAEGDKYTASEIRRLQQQYAEAKDPLKKSKILTKIQQWEKKLLSDKYWTVSRTLTNLKNQFAGASDIILSDSLDWLHSKYEKQGAQLEPSSLISEIRKTNGTLADLTQKAVDGDKVAIMELATQLNLDIVSPDLKKTKSIYYYAFYRANKMFLKTENYLTNMMNNLNKKSPAAAWAIRQLIPFIRTTMNSTLYVIDRSPIGLAKGIMNALKTKAKWAYQMQQNIELHYIQKYTQIMQDNIGDKFKFDSTEFQKWTETTLKDNPKVLQALNGDKKAILEVFKSMTKEGLVDPNLIGSDNMYARGEVLEQIAQGATGTAYMTLGLILGALTDAFEYDDDDEYLGPVVKIGDIKIGLSDLSPFATLFTLGAVLTSDGVDNNVDAAFKVFMDSTILSTLDSALAYSDGVWDYAKNQSINIISQYTQPAITKAIAKLMNNSKKDKSGSWGIKLIKTLGANSLIFNHLVPNKINPYTGEQEKYYDTAWWETLFDVILPVDFRVDGRSELEKEAEAVGAQTTGLSGKFTINDVEYKLTNKTKEKYATYKAQYINNKFDRIKSGSEKVTIKDEKTGKYKTTTYDKLTTEEKARVLKNLYSRATEITKIQYWLDKGNYYYTSDKDTYLEYKKLFGSSAKVVYRASWSKSKFVEG